jgi:adenine phosphoribosyltransferase
MDLAKKIRDIPDFPVKGVLFKDITTLLKDPDAFQETIDALVDHYIDDEVDVVAAIESRGFIFGAPLAYELAAGFVPIRKPGRLPSEKISADYTLEYGTNTLEIHKDAIQPGQRVLLVDDVLATGGSAKAAAELVERLGGKLVGIAFAIDLTYLKGMEKLTDYDVFSLIQY